MSWYEKKQKQCEELADIFEEKGDMKRSQYYTQEAATYKKMAEEYV